MSETLLSTNLSDVQRKAFRAGWVGLALLAVGFLIDAEAFYQAYLIAFLFWLGPALGSLGVVMLHNLTGGAWGFAIRRLLEAAMRSLPLMALLFLPILVGGVHDLYEWADADKVAKDHFLQHKAPYLNRGFFTVRAVFFFGLWTFLGSAMVRLQARYDRRLEIKALRQMKIVSGVGLALYVLSMSFAAFDWAMSLEPHWFSTIYGVLFVIGQALSTFCFATFIASRIARHEPFSRWYQPGQFHDLGNLIMAFVMLWAYVSFSQFLIIWSGNLPEETPWYLHRIGHGWQVIAIGLVVFHFLVPFLILLNRRAKRDMGFLAKLCATLFLLRFVEIFWLIKPAFSHGGESHFSIGWMDVVAPVALGGIWIGMFVKNLRGRPLVSLQDAKLLGELEEAPAQ